jgi:tRNA pseudouridine38-40 synthase
VIGRPFWRTRLEIEFDGTPFAGWQRQENALSVQEVIEEAARRFAKGDVHCYGAGRTDAGVHALAMTAHLDIQKDRSSSEVMGALNALMRPHPVAIIRARSVGEDFHARFSATERHYVYRIAARRPPLALDRNRAWQVPYPLDAAPMREAAAHLVGKHDFTTFRSAHCQAKYPVKSLSEITIEERGEEIRLFLRAPSFLHNQVRSIVGTLERAGAGRWTPDDVRAALEARDRAACGPVAPASGLYFARAVYPAAG